MIRYVHEIILHPKDLRPTITFEDVFKHCDLVDAIKWQKQDARKNYLCGNGKSKSIERNSEF